MGNINIFMFYKYLVLNYGDYYYFLEKFFANGNFGKPGIFQILPQIGITNLAA